MSRTLLVSCLVCFCFLSNLRGDEPIGPRRAAEIFSKIKKHAGLWRGRSTKGWEDRLKVQIVSRGSAILNTSEFVDSPGEGMVTMFYMDGDRLLLTHYCEAGNQPTLAATSEASNGDILFEFVDGTNMPDRNTGHMDKVIYRFLDDNHYTSQWTWYAKGRESWLENIEYERLQ